MKKWLFVLSVAALCCAQAGSTRFAPKAESPRRYVTDDRNAVSLIGGGKVNFEVVTPAKGSRTAKFAAAELAAFLGQIAGAKVPVLNAPTGKKCAFIVGDPAAAAAAGLDLKKLDRDGFYIKSFKGNVIIIGNDDPKGHPARLAAWNERGTLNGVYEFLERFGGVRFYFPSPMGTIVPAKKEWRLPALDIADRPDSQYRRIYSIEMKELNHGKKDYLPADMNFSDTNRLTILRTRMSTLNIPNCHGLAYLGLIERFKKSHPEYFALRPDGTRVDGTNVTHPNYKRGHVCFSSGIKEEIYQDAAAFLSGKPATSRNVLMPDGKVYWHPQLFSLPFFNIMPNDSMFPCKCDKCKAEYAKGPQAVTDLVWRFETDIAKRLQQNKIPGYITVMAYSDYKKIPTMEIPTNVIVQLALTGPWKESNPAEQAKDDKLLADWFRKLGQKTYLWTYVNKSGSRIEDIPNFTPRAVGSYFERTAKHSFGAFLEAETDHWLFGFLNMYVFGKVMWDNKTDVNALIDEHCRLMYGPGAPQMKQVYDTWEKHWLKDILTNTRETPEGPKAVLPSKFDIWNKIYSEAEIKRIDGLFDQAEQAAVKAHDGASLTRIGFIRREIWNKVVEGRKEYVKAAGDRGIWTTCVPKIKEKITIDGKLSEKAWSKALPVYMIPRTGAAIEVNTKVKMLRDDDNLYVGIESEEPFTDKMLCAPRGRDDFDLWRDNVVELFFTETPRSEFMYQIMLASSGTVTDIRWQSKFRGWKWDSKLEYKAGVVPGKMWVAEVRLPLSAMPELKDRKSFMVNFTRGRLLKGKEVMHYYVWTPFPNHNSENFGVALVKDFPEETRTINGKKPITKTRLVIPGEENSVIKFGDFDAPILQKRFIGDWGHPHNWFGVSKLTLDHKIFRSAGSALLLEWDGANDRACQYLTGLKPNTKYRFSYFVRLENVKPAGKKAAGFSAFLRMGGSGERNQSISLPEHAMSGTTDWIRIAKEFTTVPDVGSKYRPWVQFSVNGTSGKVWIDHVRLEEVK
ncbi:MAG: DUF4838 domain-containing protein [Lentisphaeria bacterium]|nr:DUF4838 domain-containing protein [Lentisphaeria bacterium]